MAGTPDIPAFAQACVQTWPVGHIATSMGVLPVSVVMMAIAGAESSWIPDPCFGHNCDWDPSTPYNCQGWNAFGGWQIEGVHDNCFAKLGAGSTPCERKAFASVPANCARLARCLAGAIPTPGSLSPWTTWTGGRWKAFVPQAKSAIAAVQGGGSGSGSDSGNGTGTGNPPGTKPPSKAPKLSGGQVAAIVTATAVLATGAYLLTK